ncbi:MAG: PcfJ domain-containing protein [Burkholderiales bacterium]
MSETWSIVRDPRGTSARRSRPSAAAGTVVLEALSRPRGRFLDFAESANRRRLILGNALALELGGNGRLGVKSRDAAGRWRPAPPTLLATPMLDAKRLAEQAVVLAAESAIATGMTAAGGTLAPADLAYCRRRLGEDLYPEAAGERAACVLRRALLTAFLPHPLTRAALLAFGPGATLADRADCLAAGAATLIRLAGEAPNLMPLIVPLVRRHARKRADGLPLGAFGDTKRSLACLGLSDAGWRWLAHQPRSLVAALFPAAQDAPARHQAVAAQALYETGLASIPAALLPPFCSGGRLETLLEHPRFDAARRADLARLVRIVAVEIARREKLGVSLRFVREDAAYLLDWWIDQSVPGRALVPSGATFASLIRRQQHWHQAMILLNPEFMRRWTSAVPAHLTAGVRAVPLTDSLMLAREGMEMRHCVASYANDCAAGAARVFALEDEATGERATAALRRRAWVWFAGQVKGPCNAPVSAGLAEAAQRLAARYTRMAAR